MDIRMNTDAIDFVRQHGVVLESARGPVPNLAEAVAGAPIRGNWWTHPDGKKIFRATRLARDCKDILVCRLVGGKVTYVDRRLWPAVVRLASYFGTESLAAIREEHTDSGAHQVKTLPFPGWVPSMVRESAKTLSDAEAATQLGPWATALMRRRDASHSLAGHGGK
jgi:hypothetical protein